MLELWMLPVSLFFGLISLSLAMFWGGSAVSCISELISRFSGNKLLDKFALQVSRMSLWGLILLLCCSLALLADGMYGPVAGAQWWVAVAAWPKPLWMGWLVLLGAGAFLQIITTVSWNALKKHWKVLHLLLSCLTLLVFAALSWSGVNGVFLSMAEAGAEGAGWSVSMMVWPPQAALAWPVFACCLFLCLGGAGITGGIYLIRRRDKDDFGRDYYQKALPRAAKWGLLFGVQLLVIAQLVFFNRPGRLDQAMQADMLLIGLGAVLCFCLQTLLVFILSRSGTPLRMKATMIGSGLLAWFGQSLTLLWIVLIL